MDYILEIQNLKTYYSIKNGLLKESICKSGR